MSEEKIKAFLSFTHKHPRICKALKAFCMVLLGIIIPTVLAAWLDAAVSELAGEIGGTVAFTLGVCISFGTYIYLDKKAAALAEKKMADDDPSIPETEYIYTPPEEREDEPEEDNPYRRRLGLIFAITVIVVVVAMTMILKAGVKHAAESVHAINNPLNIVTEEMQDEQK